MSKIPYCYKKIFDFLQNGGWTGKEGGTVVSCLTQNSYQYNLFFHRLSDKVFEIPTLVTGTIVSMAGKKDGNEPIKESHSAFSVQRSKYWARRCEYLWTVSTLTDIQVQLSVEWHCGSSLLNLFNISAHNAS